MLVKMRSSGFRPNIIFASEPVASSTFFAWTWVTPPSGTLLSSTVCTPFFAGPVSLP